MKLSILVPVYNEQNTVEKILNKVLAIKLPVGFKKEIIVVDDGSSDNTLRILKQFKNIILIKHLKNQGKGSAVRAALRRSSGDIIAIQDADLEYDPKFFIDLLEPFIKKSAEVVYGSRLINYPLKLYGENKTPLPSHWLGNKFLTLLTNLLYVAHLTDMETCYKFISRKAISSITLKSNHFEIEPEITAKLLKKGYEIREVPIQITPRTHSEGKKIVWQDGLTAVWVLVKYRFSN